MLWYVRFVYYCGFYLNHQSAYCKHHSTETAHQCNRITKSIMPLPSRSLCCLWHHRPQHLNHSPLILVWYSWLCVLSWFKSYLSSRSFRVKCDDNLSSFHTSFCGVPKALFSALYFSSCTPHLSALLSLLFPSTTTFTQMVLSSSSLFTHSTSTQAFLTFKTLFNTSLPGWLLTFLPYFL